MRLCHSISQLHAAACRLLSRGNISKRCLIDLQIQLFFSSHSFSASSHRPVVSSTIGQQLMNYSRDALSLDLNSCLAREEGFGVAFNWMRHPSCSPKKIHNESVDNPIISGFLWIKCDDDDETFFASLFPGSVVNISSKVVFLPRIWLSLSELFARRREPKKILFL